VTVTMSIMNGDENGCSGANDEDEDVEEDDGAE
jgi:hypothetical protein